MTRAKIAPLLTCFLVLFLSFPCFAITGEKPGNFFYHATVTSGDYFQEIRHHQSGDLIRQVIYAPPFPPTVTIVRPDLDVIWYFDEGGWEYFSSPYYPVLVANILDLEVANSEELIWEVTGVETILGYECEITRCTNPVAPSWEVTLWLSPELGGFPLKKRERIIEEGTIISEILVEIKEFSTEPVPPEYFVLPSDLIPAKEEWKETDHNSSLERTVFHESARSFFRWS